MVNNKKDFLTLNDYEGTVLMSIIKKASDIKAEPKKYEKILSGKNIAMLFDKHSTRTRLSFEAGINQLGGNCLILDSKSLQISRGETVQDTAIIFSRYLDGLVIRTFKHEIVESFARYCSIPVINGLTDSYHPCQALSDMFTLYEIGLLDKSLKFSYVGDCNNVANSLILGLLSLGIDITIGCPLRYGPGEDIKKAVEKLSKKTGAKLNIVEDPITSVSEADVIYTDVWISMGDESSDDKIDALKRFQVNREMLKAAKKDVKVMHCLPAHRESEITSDILDDRVHSIVWDQAENRLHAQKSLLIYLLP